MQDQWNRKGALGLIESKGLKMRWIADKLGMHAQTLSRIMSSSRRPKQTTLMALAMTLGCSLEFLLAADQKKQAS